jgi:hypothetical protein
MTVPLTASHSSDQWAYKNNGEILTTSLNFDGSVGAGAFMTRTTTITPGYVMDHFKLLYDNSVYSSGKFRDITIEPSTAGQDTTSPGELAIDLSVAVTSTAITITGRIFNPYVGSVNIGSTTLNFRYIPYIDTI